MKRYTLHLIASALILTGCGEKLIGYQDYENIKYPSTRCIFYTSDDGYTVLPNTSQFGGATIVSNKYKGIGAIAFDAMLTQIAQKAFWGCYTLTHISIPDCVSSIEDNAFSGTSLEEIIIPYSVRSIGEKAFYECEDLKKVTLQNNMTEIAERSFCGCTSLKSINIPKSVTTIGASAFYDCTSLKDLVLPDNITSIGERAFHNCSSLTKVTIPDSVTEIGRYAFYSCNDLRKVTIGKNVTTIGPQAFGYCGSLYKIYCRAATPPSISSDVFFHNYTWEDYIFKICVPHESVSAYKKAWSEYADQIVGYDFD